MHIGREQRDFIDCLRGLSILRVVLGHLGLFWLLRPYSEFLHALLPLLFFVSGAVSFGSFLRSDNSGRFLLRRLVLIISPYYALLAVALPLGLFWQQALAYTPSMDGVVRLLLLNPKQGDLFFPIGQVWFLHALLLITVVALPLFGLARRAPHWLWLPVIISLLLSTVQLFTNLSPSLTVLGHNSYQAWSNMGFFFFGAWYIQHHEQRWLSSLMPWLAVGAVIMAIGGLQLSGGAVGLSHHSYAPNLYYLGCSFTVLALILALQAPLIRLFFALPRLKQFLLFTSVHAYSIFLLHSFFIFASEYWLGLANVSSRPLHALAKVLLVLVACYLCCPLLTRFSQWLGNRLLGLLALPPRNAARGSEAS